MNKSEILERLTTLVRLDIGWDGYRGKPVLLENAFLHSIY